MNIMMDESNLGATTGKSRDTEDTTTAAADGSGGGGDGGGGYMWTEERLSEARPV